MDDTGEKSTIVQDEAQAPNREDEKEPVETAEEQADPVKQPSYMAAESGFSKMAKEDD